MDQDTIKIIESTNILTKYSFEFDDRSDKVTEMNVSLFITVSHYNRTEYLIANSDS